MERIILISCDAPTCLLNILSRYGEVRKLPHFSLLPEPVCSHGDMLTFFSRKENVLFVPQGYYEEHKNVFEDIRVEPIDEVTGKEYPRDIYLDALPVGEYLLCKSTHTAEKIKAGRRIINVKQGYARCSVCLLGQEGAITADKGLKTALEELGIPVMMIQSGNILLDGYSYGFIGGASLVIDKNVIFFGNVARHPEGERILEFVRSYGYTAEYPEEMTITDLGSAAVIEIDKSK